MFNKRILIGAVVALPLLYSLPVSAQNYVGLSYSDLEADSDFINSDIDTGVLNLKFGGQLDEVVSIEARVGFGVSGDSLITQSGNLVTEYDYQIDNTYGVYGKMSFFKTGLVKPYGLLGFTAIQASTTSSVFNTNNGSRVYTSSEDETETDMSFALGADINFQDKYTFNLEFGNYYNDDGIELKGVTLGFSSLY
jgi:opacity protein-like surface antigen